MNKVSNEVAEFVEGLAHPVRFFSTSDKSTHYESTFWGKYGKPFPFESYECCFQVAVQESLKYPEIQAAQANQRLNLAWKHAREGAIQRFVAIANGLVRWQQIREQHPSLTTYEVFTDTGWHNMNGVGREIAMQFGLSGNDARIMDFIKWEFTIDYNWKMLRLFRVLQRSDDRKNPIPTVMIEAINRLAMTASSSPSLFTKVFAEAYFSGYLFARNCSIMEIVDTQFGSLLGDTILLSAKKIQDEE
jgi:hypothetical protein